jgi:hypothetical protein
LSEEYISEALDVSMFFKSSEEGRLPKTPNKVNKITVKTKIKSHLIKVNIHENIFDSLGLRCLYTSQAFETG